ncbi:uncharacterized protein LOC113229373 isoform X2 [Hyposmocoma kahamanoa]|uniref:uncharacterized protein LOC113229373 isoform X2 n=1 Tax=Hyposmocoma kahamanoa TaxID=1477025 RepID=UPI000E6D68BF|nr:uncharacterized protein LOC113229373 isoform X2 [Hyposmocoma kahamanoa]
MQRGWEGKMRAALCLLLLAACVCADDSEDRHSKLPYVADAVGNTLPPPSNLPATVGSPVNLLTPDRYEFYTFDESGELVKRLMTLEEIQAIVAAATYITERTTVKSVPVQTTRTTVASTTKRAVSSTTKSPPSSASVKIPPTVSTTRKPFVSTVGYVSSTPKTDNFEKLNVTTITTQSIFPPTIVSSTEHISLAHLEDKSTTEKNNNESDPPIFDVAQSISQIASDLGNYRPNPTTSDLLDTTRFTEMNLESKENIEIDIPTDSEKDTDIKTSSTTEKNTDNFVKISTLEPHQTDQRVTDVKEIPKTDNIISSSTTEKMVLSTSESITTTIDPVLSESMDDLLSQIVNEAPQNIMETETSTAIVYKETSETTKEKLQITTKTPENKTEKNEITTKVPLKLVEESTKISEQKPDQKNVTTNILDNNIPAVDTRKKEEITINKDHASLKEEDKSEPNKKEQQNYNKVSLAPSKNNEKVKPTTTISNNEKIVEETKGNESDIKTIKKDIPEKETKKPNYVSSQDKDAKTTTTTQSPKLVSATEETLIASKKPDNVLSQPAINKVGSIINEKEKNVAEELIPKIDEFKKKIQKVNIDDKELANERNNSWKLISTVSPPKANEIPKDRLKTDSQDNANDKDILLEFSKENQGLEVTTKNLGEDIAQFTELCNELAFRYWHTMIETIDKKRSFVLSPYSITSMLAMMFMGARGATSGEMNEILKLDDMVTFNPHFTLKNISDSIETTSESGIIVSAFIRELFSDRSRGKILTFYKERAQHFYNGHVEEVNFKLISDIIRRRTNLLVKRYTWGRIVEYMKSNSIIMQPPLAAFSANIFQTDCSGSTVEGRDGEMYFVVSPNVRQRRLVPVPAVVYRTGFLAGYDPALDATAAALGNSNSIISTLFVMPGQQGNIVHADDLEALEKRLLDSNPTTPAWNRLLRTLLPRIGLELQIPRFSHKSIFNISSTLKQMGLKDLFDADHADLGGLNGPSKDLHLSDMIQMTTFVTCGEGIIGEQHHIEEYPENLEERQKRRTSRWINDWDEPRDYQRAFHDPHDVGEAMRLPLHLRPRQARLPARNAQPARLKFDRPFLYFVRHNPSGMILYVGRYNPRLLP